MVRLTAAQVEAAAIQTAPAEVKNVRQAVRVPGTIASPDTAQAIVGSIVEGRVVRVNVVPGDRVRAGQSLVEIHTHELSDAQAQLTAATAELTFHTQAAERAETLYEAGAISLEELQRRAVDLEAAQAEQARAREMVDHLYPTALGDASAVAPFAGVVFTVSAHAGQAVVPGTPLVELGTTDLLWVTAFVPENTSATLRTGDTVTVSFQALQGASADARLVRMGEFVDPANRSVEMRFELAEIPQGVRPGSFATVDIAVANDLEGVELTEDATVRIGADEVVFIEEERGLYRALPVRVTQLAPGTVVVRGIPDGAAVVVEGSYFLKSALEARAAEGDGTGEAGP